MAGTDWRVVYLRALGAKPTPAALDFLARWQPFEGGHTNNNARFNYLNTTQRMPGSHEINSVGVQSYGSLAQGAQAFARTLLGNSHYGSLVSFLKTGKGDPSPGLQTWVSGSPNGNPTYAEKVLGGHVSQQAPAPTPAGLPSVDPVPLSEPNVVGQVHAQARQGLQDIATGDKQATDTLGDIAGLMKTLNASGVMQSSLASHVQVGIPTMAQGGSALDAKAAALVHKYLGVKYTWGGTSVATGFDCSGLVQTVWKQLGIKVPRTSQEQWKAGKPVSQLQPGDAVFFGSPDGPHHEGMYIGNGKFIEAPHTGAVVRVGTLAGRKDFVGARRFA